MLVWVISENNKEYDFNAGRYVWVEHGVVAVVDSEEKAIAWEMKSDNEVKYYAAGFEVE